MPMYRRWYRRGGTYFLTIVTYRRAPFLTSPLARDCLRQSLSRTRKHLPFVLDELVLLPDHFHLILTLPDGVDDFPSRIGGIKARFTRLWLDGGGGELPQSGSRTKLRHRGIWQKRFWEHLVRNESDLWDCRAYCWYNPVKHRLASCPHAWPYSTFHRAVRRGRVLRSWSCACAGGAPPSMKDIPGAEAD